MPFLTAGDPDLATTAAIIREMERRGADLVELGIPYSDPIADGPTIQSSYVRALDGGFKVMDALDMVRNLRADCALPILTMVSFSIVSRIGAETYFDRASDAGIDGVIIPDLPADEGRNTARMASAAGLHPVFLVAPTTSPTRMKRIVKLSRGFIYYISVAGITGARNQLPSDLADHITALRQSTKKPIAIGFGISRPEHVASVAAIADGAIVGSAIVKKIHSLAGQPRDEIVAQVGDFVQSLADAKCR